MFLGYFKAGKVYVGELEGPLLCYCDTLYTLLAALSTWLYNYLSMYLSPPLDCCYLRSK